MSNRILFVSSFDLGRNTSSNIRTVALIQTLSENGWIVDVAYLQSSNQRDETIERVLYTSSNSIFPLISCEQSNNAKYYNNNDTNKISIRVRKNVLQLYSKLFVYDVFQTRFRKINKSVLQQINDDYDFILSSSEPRSSHKLALIIKKRRKLSAKWIQYWGDPMTNDVASNKFFPSFERKEEKKLLSLADFALYTNPGCKQYMRNKYRFAINKIYWIPTTDLGDSCGITKEKNKNKELTLCYVGDYISRYRDIMPLFNACKSNNLKLSIVGNGDSPVFSCHNIKVCGRVDRKKADQIEQSSTILVVIDNHRSDKEECIQVPGKLYHYALTNKFVLVITNSSSLIEHYSCFKRFVFCRNSEEEILNSITRINNGLFPSNFSSPLLNFSHESIYKVFLDIINNHKVL